MKILPSGLINSFSGSTGGSTFRTSSQGCVISRKSSSQHRSSNVNATTTYPFTVVTQKWQKLSQSDRDAWNVFAASNPVTSCFNLQKKLSGFQYYCKVFFTLVYLGYPFFTSPSLIHNNLLFQPKQPIFDVALGTIKIEVDAISFGDVFCLYMSSPFSPGISSSPKSPRMINTWDVHLVASTENIKTLYEDLFGNSWSNCLNSKVSCRLMLMSFISGYIYFDLPFIVKIK